MNTTNLNKPLIDMEATGRRIKNLRISHKLSVKDLQNYLGYTNPQLIYNWELGKNMPSIDNLLAMSFLFGISINDIVASKVL